MANSSVIEALDLSKVATKFWKEMKKQVLHDHRLFLNQTRVY